MQRLTEADRDSQRSAGSCKEMRRQLGRQRQGEIDAEIDRGRDRDSQRGALRGKEIKRQSAREAETEIDAE